MPIYEYLCSNCGHRFELLKAKMTRKSRQRCPECGGRAEQQLSTFGVGASRSEQETPCGASTCPVSPDACPSGTCPYSQN